MCLGMTIYQDQRKFTTGGSACILVESKVLFCSNSWTVGTRTRYNWLLGKVFRNVWNLSATCRTILHWPFRKMPGTLDTLERQWQLDRGWSLFIHPEVPSTRTRLSSPPSPGQRCLAPVFGHILYMVDTVVTVQRRIPFSPCISGHLPLPYKMLWTLQSVKLVQSQDRSSQHALDKQRQEIAPSALHLHRGFIMTEWPRTGHNMSGHDLSNFSQWKISTRLLDRFQAFPFGSVPLTLTRSPLT